MGAEPGPDPANLGDLGMNAGWVADLREQYDLHPKNVDASWAELFGHNGEVTLEARPAPQGAPDSAAATLGPPVAPADAVPGGGPVDSGAELRRVGPEIARKHAATLRLIHAYRARGHRVADTNPLVDEMRTFSELEPANYGFTEADMEKSFLAGNLPGGPVQTFREILEQLRETYCRYVGVEFTHIQDPDRKEWLVDRMEHTRNETHFTNEERRDVLESLVAAEMFERFVHTRFLGQKRFSLEGAESLIPLLNEMVERAPHYGIREFVFGMAHRGRLNVLCNIVGKSWESVFSEFEDTPNLEVPFGSGDVKYHKGYSSNRVTRTGQTVHLSLTSNPSHLEMVNPVVEGRARAKQTRANDFIGHSIVPVLIHGDAAFAGQGVVAETLNLSQLQGYFTGGTLHIIVDNQIGFTTTPAEARSTLYATDVAKMIQVPIFHANGDHPEAVLHAMRLALSYRQRFRSDAVINLVCYRRHGHNEGDEPSYTQPRLYEKIKTMVPVRKKYTEYLIELGVMTRGDAEEIEESLSRQLDEALERIKTAPPEPSEGYEPRGPWTGFSRTLPKVEPATKLAPEQVQTLMERAGRLPDDFRIHPKLAKMLRKRMESLEAGEGLDWAFGETLAYAALLEDGYAVRISGQDSSRGTFSHRHAVYVDQRSGEEYAPLAHLSAGQGRFEVHDSLLSEAAVLGFEYGYSLADPQTLVIWEAQFGDFVNGAQVVIDQFISCAHVKWQRMSGLVMLLPHGFEGQGPEHSSGRIERFLQLCAEQNMQVANCTTPAQIFHLLRRQMVRKYRSPLIVFTPKSLLRHPLAVSTLDEFTEGKFEPAVRDPLVTDPKIVRRVLFCSGKVYYDLVAARAEAAEVDPSARHPYDIAIVRLEQVYPWPQKVVADVLAQYPSKREVAWVQEEPANQGAWFFIRHRLEAELGRGLRLQFVGRPAAAAPAVGSARLHQMQQRKLVRDALELPKEMPEAKKKKAKAKAKA